ncbi:hypothetical protein C0Z01_13970 [Photobacterium kishitanii]|uniref:Retropepsin-like aspartic endopeptidase domain-containing protein n=1 Tax=Photobacterium kishitanii TaxID=318456 RepID=A0A2T3KDW0_9GAMM|nr:RimK/LysX family protein [Photobacterium kishitanii]KJG10713.1 hypothetical protein UB40_04955 [Photobacterium kishitanii]KJG59725.1 hypothetical protein UA38_00695 [Photobacterium kishitanii]KJG63014.1 hypothetical protein UA42_01060 [Photobacterium kishitanii]KJG67975.1 hypothetical protein UA40_01780 [Photobacterium kishitanii]KJG71187.1 hypothetical protein UA41_00705 [Photobacterium kishitanii]
MKKVFMSAMLIAAATVSTMSYAANECNGKYIVGPVETIHVKDLNMDFKARIDTGANTTSINAYDLHVINGNNNPSNNKESWRENLGKMISFKTANAQGQEETHTGKIIKISKIRNAQGVERRYAVVMDLIWNGKSHAIPVNLRDRKKLEYKLLIGRNWLDGKYLVDVSKSDDDD